MENMMTGLKKDILKQIELNRSDNAICEFLNNSIRSFDHIKWDPKRMHKIVKINRNNSPEYFIPITNWLLNRVIYYIK